MLAPFLNKPMNTTRFVVTPGKTFDTIMKLLFFSSSGPPPRRGKALSTEEQ